MTLFDAYLAVDWSAKSAPSPRKPTRDAVWVGERVVEGDHTHPFSREPYFRTRRACLDHLRERLLEHKAAARRVFIGFDFAYGYPAGFAEACGLDGDEPPWRLVWNELVHLIEDHADNTNNRFAVAGALNARCRGTPPGPFWGCHSGVQEPCLDPKSPPYPYPTGSGRVLVRKRETELLLPGAQPTWKLWGIGSVGGQTLLGIPAVARLRGDPAFQPISRVWPFETGFGLEPVPPGMPLILHAEIWPGVVDDKLDSLVRIRDQAQVRAMVDWLAELDAANELLPLFGPPVDLTADRLRQVLDQEGWIFGAGWRAEIATSRSRS
jgi:hypothetical protein